MSGHQRTDLLRMLLGAVAGGLTLFVINLVMNPVPVAALPAFILGALGFVFMSTALQVWVTNLAAIGAVAGVFIHRGWHVEGSSPPPAEGLLTHLAVEGLIGLVAALLALAVMGLALRFLEQR